MDKPSYYAVIPANVRYDEYLPAGAKLLYGEITALCNKEGFCWATNAYFADLYSISTKTVSRWVTQLKDSGYVNVVLNHKTGTSNEQTRKISIAQAYGQNCPRGWTKMSRGMDKNVQPPHDKNVQDNITSNNNTNNICGKSGNPDIIDDVLSYLNEKAGTSYRPSTKKTRTLIQARQKEGFALSDFKVVIDKKISDWMGTDWEKYLRPETLFGTKFEGYLNEKRKRAAAPSDYDVKIC